MFLVKLKRNSSKSAALRREGFSLHDTEPQKTSNGIGSKTTKKKKDYLLIISKIPTNRQKNNKKKKKQIDHSKFMYTYTLRKELSVELGRGWVSRGERFGQLDKPCIFAIQGSYRGCRDGRPGTDRGRRRGESQGCTFTSSWGLGWCGEG